MKVITRQSKVDTFLESYHQHFNVDLNRWDDAGLDNREAKYNQLKAISDTRQLTYDDCVSVLGDYQARYSLGLICDICSDNVEVVIAYEENEHRACDYKDVYICKECLEKSLEAIIKETA